MPTDIQNLNTAISKYIQKGGISSATGDADYATIQRITEILANKKTQIIKLNHDITAAIRTLASNSDIDGLLTANGALQQQIATATSRHGELEQDMGTAIVRDKMLRTKDTHINNRQVYLLGHPLRPASIPYLWALSILFIGFAILMLYFYSPIELPSIEFIINFTFEVLYNPWFWASLFGAASIVILFLVLRLMSLI